MTDEKFIEYFRSNPKRLHDIPLRELMLIARMVRDGDLRHVNDKEFCKEMARAHPECASADYKESTT